MNVNTKSPVVALLLSIIQHYNPKKYWRFRNIVIDKNNDTPILIKYIYLLYIKRCDAYNCAALGTDLNKGAEFASMPDLPHGIKGIFIHHRAKIGKNVTIYQHVTIAQDKGLAPIIGDNVMIGTGAVLLGG